MLPGRTSRRPTDTDDADRRVVTEFDLIEPSGRWRKVRTRSRSERLRGAAITAAALLVSLALWAFYLWPLARTVWSAIGGR